MLSYSSGSTFMTCPRKYDLKYNKRLIPVSERADAVLGTAMHAVIQAHYSGHANPPVVGHTVINASNLSPEESDETHGTLKNMCRYYLPRLTEKVIETEIPVKIDDFYGVPFVGQVDAYTEDGYIIDWKIVKTIGDRELDFQLHLYAYALRALGYTVYGIKHIQLKRQTPKPAVINKDGFPSIAAQDTTLAYWLETLPLGINPDKWLDKIKVKSDNDFMNVTEYAICDESEIAEWVQVKKLMDVGVYPATQTVEACRLCEYREYCLAKRYGAEVMEGLYEVKKGSNE